MPVEPQDSRNVDDDDRSNLFQGPANWFTLRVPDTLQLEQTEAFLEICPATVASSTDDDAAGPTTGQLAVTPAPASAPWTMTLYAAWVADGEPETRAASFNPSTLFPRVAECDDVAPLKIAGKCRTWAGRSSQASTDSWWKAVLRRRSSYHWRLWVVEYQDIIVVASLQSAVNVRLTEADVDSCECVLNSIEFADVLARPPDLFRQEVIAMAQKHFPLLTISSSGSFSVKIDESDINLANFYRSYIRDPERMKQIVLPGLTTVVRLQEWGPDQLMPPLDTVADRIMPMLYPESEADGSFSDFVQVPWVSGLTIMFVVDEDDTYRFVHEKMLATWELSLDELEELAMENLELYARDNPLEVTLIGTEDDPQMLVPTEPNAYNSVRLLGDRLQSQLRQVLGMELIVGVPNRDFFVAVSLNHPQLLEQVRQRVVQDFQAMHHPLTDRLLVLSADGTSEFCET